jgi:hypothetical protein
MYKGMKRAYLGTTQQLTSVHKRKKYEAKARGLEKSIDSVLIMSI